MVMTGSFEELIRRAKNGDPLAVAELMEMYEPLLTKESKVNGETDHDLLQELWVTMFRCIQIFNK